MSSTGASRVSGATGADSSPEHSCWPREDDRAGDMQALLPPFPVSDDTAMVEEPIPGGVAASSFSLFAVGSSLALWHPGSEKTGTPCIPTQRSRRSLLEYDTA